MWALHSPSGAHAWALVTRPNAAASWATAQQEAALQRRAHGRHCLPALAAFRAAGHACVLFALARGPSLAQVLDRRRPGDLAVPAADVVALFAALTQAVAALHRANVLHRDIKPDNVLFRHAAPRPQGAWLADFAFACTAQQGSRDGAGTVAYQAPEVLAGGRHSEAADVFSLGATMIEVACGMAPYEGDSEAETAANLRAGEPWLNVSDAAAMLAAGGVPLPRAAALARLAFSLCALRPAHRPSATAALLALQEISRSE